MPRSALPAHLMKGNELDFFSLLADKFYDFVEVLKYESVYLMLVDKGYLWKMFHLIF
jgi:hypothetical protein